MKWLADIMLFLTWLGAVLFLLTLAVVALLPQLLPLVQEIKSWQPPSPAEVSYVPQLVYYYYTTQPVVYNTTTQTNIVYASPEKTCLKIEGGGKTNYVCE